MDRAAQRFRSGQGLCCSAVQRVIIVLRNQKNGHYCNTPASARSLSTSSLAVFTLMPAFLVGGSAVFITLILGVMSTPSAAASRSSKGFFFAFMMFGSDA